MRASVFPIVIRFRLKVPGGERLSIFYFQPKTKKAWSKPSLLNMELRRAYNEKVITVHYQDPVGTGNQYRFVMYVNNVEVKSVFAFNDDFTNGRYVHNELREDDIKIYPGDTVTVEMQCIDKPIYTYWLTLMQQGNNGPGGAVAPSNPPTNISPATLGYFSAHTTQSKTIIVK
jgi:hypothetical protein